MSKHSNIVLNSVTSVVALGFFSLVVFAQVPAKDARPSEKQSLPAEKGKTPAANESSVAPPPTAGNVSDPQDVEAFFDGVVNVQLNSKHIAGAVVALVVGNKVVFTKGYGYADIESRRPVDPNKTLFRIGSISKLFTWTAVMQQVEAGKLDLNTDINLYLNDVKVPATFEQPITLKNLLTHTPGFDDPVLGLFARRADEVGTLAEAINSQMPKRVRPPGILASYSNHGTALAGYAVACISGLPWEDYIKQKILQPLGMDQTLVRQPAEDALPALLSKGYKWDGGQFVVKGFEYLPAAPAGCISTTGADAAKFMLAHLNDGQLGNNRILKSETARQMREPLFRHDPKTSAMCYGFWEEQHNGQRMVGHGGDTLWFHGLMQLIPDRHVGVFVAYNTDTGAGAGKTLFDAFLQRYYPSPDPPRSKSVDGFRERAQKLTGEYGSTRYSHTSVTKLGNLMGSFDVSMNDDDTLTISMGGTSGRFVEIEPFVFREQDGTRRIVFEEAKDGHGTYLFLANSPPLSAVRLEWYEWSLVHWGLLAGSVGVFASALFFWPAIAFSVRGLSSPRIKRTWFSGLLSWLAWLLSAAGIAFTAGLGYSLSDSDEIVFGLTPLIKGLLAVTPYFAGLAVLTLIGCVIAWRNRYWGVTGRLHYTLVALAGVAFTWFLYYWNLLPIGPGSV